jgi:hypothetical protein
VPAVFTVFDDLERWLAPKAGKLLAEPVGTPAGRLPGSPLAGGILPGSPMALGEGSGEPM